MDFRVDGLRAHAATGSRPLNPSEPAVLFVHGAGMDRTVWQLQTRNVAHRGYQAYAIDLPGHGRSEGDALASIGQMTDWLGKFMDAAGLKTATLVGHSMGALIALQFAARAPQRIDKLCLMGIAEHMPVHPDLLDAARCNETLAPELIVYWGLGDAAQRGGHPHPGLWVKGASQTLLEQARADVLYVDLTACNQYKEGLSCAAAVTCETLFVLGQDDKMTPVIKALPLCELIASSSTVVIKKCGHMVMLEHPHAVYEALKSFI